jgi:hypothetical protein
MGCGCKKKNVQTTVNPSPATITLNETIQPTTTMDQQVQQLVQKIEEINNALESEEEGQ